eukprot:scaffold13_cov377-Prasinococcus_capsulatus_cf.AAC.2
MVQAAQDCLCAKCVICITDAVMAELEKLGSKYRVALKAAKDTRFERLPAMTKGNYADDDLVARVQQVWNLAVAQPRLGMPRSEHGSLLAAFGVPD